MAHYRELEEAAASFYRDFKVGCGGKVSSNIFLLTQKLNQIRIACSGGRYPLEDKGSLEEEANQLGGIGSEEATGKKKHTNTDYALATIAWNASVVPTVSKASPMWSSERN